MNKTIGQVLAACREEKKLSQHDVARELRAAGFDITNQAVSRWELDQRRPNAELLIALCRILGIYHLTAFFEDNSDYGRLSPTGQRKVDEYAHVLATSGLYEREKKVFPLRKLPVYNIAASAGTGQFLDSSDYDLMEVGEDVPMSANFGIYIAGDSMEPRYEDGQLVWVQQQLTLEDGEIGIVLYDGCSYCKKLSRGADGIRLISLNPKYEPIDINTDYSELRVFGKVVS